MQIQISWLLQKPTDLDLHCLQKQGISRFSRTRVNINNNNIIKIKMKEREKKGKITIDAPSREITLDRETYTNCDNFSIGFILNIKN